MGRNFEELEHDTGDDSPLSPKQKKKAKSILSQKRNRMVKAPPKTGVPKPQGIVKKFLGILTGEVHPLERSNFCSVDGRVWETTEPDEDD